jgi:uncharacterized protein YbcI
MTESNPTRAQQIARAVSDFERQRTGQVATSVAVALSGDTLVVTLHGVLSPAEQALARSAAGIARVEELYRLLFTDACGPLRQEIRRITGVDVREAKAEVRSATGAVVPVFTSGTVLHVFLLAGSVPAETWSGSGRGG